MNRLDDRQVEGMVDCLSNQPRVICAYCFGSQSRGDNPLPRDIDIAVLSESRMTLADLLHLRRELSLALGTDRLDVVDLRSAGPVLKRNVIAADLRFYCRDDHAANEFELLALSQYYDSAHRRRQQTEILRREYASA